MDISTLSGLIVFLGTPAAVNWIVSNVLDHFDPFVKLDAIYKKVVVLALAILLALGSAYVTQNISPTFFEQFKAFYAVVYATLLAFWTGEIQHETRVARMDKKALRKEQVKTQKNIADRAAGQG